MASAGMSAGTLTSFDLGGVVAESAPADPVPAQSGIVAESGWGTSMSFPSFVGGSGLALFAGDRDNDPLLSGRYGGYWPADRVTLPTKGPPGVFTEVELRAIVSWSRYVCQRNPLAMGFRDRVTEFVGPVDVRYVRRGQSPGASASGPQDADGDGQADADPEVSAAQQVWDDWREMYAWGQGIQDREQECRERTVEDGELFLRFGAGTQESRFLPWVRHVEPEQVRTPTGPVALPDSIDPADVDWRWGIATSRRDSEHVYGFWVADIDSGGATGEFVPAAEMVHLKVNVKRADKRGLPDLFPVEHALQDSLRVLLNMGDAAGEQSRVAWREKYAGTGEQVRAMLNQGPDAYGRRGGELPDHPSGRFRVRTHNGVKVVHAEQGREFVDGPVAAGAQSFVAVVDATLKAVGFRWGIPDWFAGGSSDSFAGALVTGSPFVRAISSRQDRMKGLACSVAGIVLALAEASGLLAAGTADRVKPVASAKPVVIADEEKQTRTDLALYDKNLADPVDIIKKRGGDPKQVAANITTWRKKFGDGGDGQQPAPAARPAPGPKDPTPTPPGSAGGDGSSPSTDPLGAFGGSVQEHGYTGSKTDALGHKRTYVDGKQVANPDQVASSPARASGQDTATAGAGWKSHPVTTKLATALKSAPGLSDDQRAEYGKAAASVLGRMTATAHDRLAKHVTASHFHADNAAVGMAVAAEVEPINAGKAAELRRIVDAGGMIGGAYVGRTGSLHADGGLPAGGQTTSANLPENSVPHIYAHEWAHAVDGPQFEVSNSPAWQAAFEAEFGGGRLTKYASSSPSEAFAEFARLVWASPVPPAKVEAAFPKAVAVWREAGLWA